MNLALLEMRSFSVAGAATDAAMHVVRGRVCDTSDLKLLRAPLILEEPITDDEGGAKPETPASLFVSKTERKTAPTEQDEILRRRWWRTRASCLIFLLYVLLVFVIHPHSYSLPAILPLTQMRDVYGGSIPINIMNEPGEFLAACMRHRQRLSMALLFSHRSSRHQRAPMTTTSVVVPAIGKPHQVTIISRHSHEASKAGCAGDGGWLQPLSNILSIARDCMHPAW